jgi:serine/threonine protein kinase
LLKAGLKTQTAVGGEVPDADRAPPTPAELAACFPDLEILEFIGRGGMGMVYKARQIHLNRFVALKILSPKIASDPAFAERFNREAQAMALLSHPHVVVVHDFGRCDFPATSEASPPISKSEVLGQASTPSVPLGKGTEGEFSPLATPGRGVGGEGRKGDGQLYYFLMEYVDGVNLRQLLDAGKLLPKQALAIVPQICEALQYAHDHGVVHRDIKPENILIDKAGQVKIADFGLAKLIGRGAKTADRSEEAAQNAPPADPTLTAAGQVMGTPYYMAPEQTEHPKEVDHRADIYSLGVVFYQMLTGELPIGRFAPPSKKVEIDVRLDEVVLRALEKEPGRRYQHVSEIKTRIETISSTDRLDSNGKPAASIHNQWHSRLMPIGIRNGKKVINLPVFAALWPLVYLVCAGVMKANHPSLGIMSPDILLTCAWMSAGWTALIMGIFCLSSFERFLPIFDSPRPPAESSVAATSTTRSSEPRFSKAAIIGAIWAIPLFLLLIFFFIPKNSDGPSIFGGILYLMLPFGVLAPFGTTILGAVSLSQIRHSAGRLYGLGLALFDTLLFPLLLPNGLIVSFVWLFLDDLWSSARRGQINSESAGITTVVLAILVAFFLFIVNYFIIRWAWRAANRPVKYKHFQPTSLAPESILARPQPEQSPVDRAATEQALRQVQAPAIGLLVLGILHSLVFLPLLVILLPAFEAARHAANRAGAGVGVEGQIIPFIFPALWILECVLMIVAGVKMKQLRAYGLAVAASILTIVSLNPLGIAIGIWALVVLCQQDVRNAFWAKSHLVVPNPVPLKARRLGLAALILCLLGFPLPFVQIAALVCGILGRKSGTGKTALVISSTYLLFLSMFFGYVGYCKLQGMHNDFGGIPNIVSLNPTRSDAPTAIDIAQQPVGPWIAKLPQGSIELVAVSYNPSEGKPWWRPDGSPCTEGPFTNPGARCGESETMKAREFVARMRDLPGGSSLPVWNIDRSGGHADGGMCQRNCSLVSASLPKSDRTANLQIGVASGPWQTIDTIKPAFGGHSGGGRFGDANVNVSFPKPVVTADGGAVVNVAYSTIEGEVRVVAIDKKGQEITSSRTEIAGVGDSVHQITATFGKLPRTPDKEFRFQARPYRWVEFRNVMLEPTTREAVPSETTKPEESVASLGASIEKMDIENAPGPWIVTLPQSGVRVELLGVSEHPSKDKPWWKPDGAPLPERPYDEWGMGFRASKETNGKYEKKYPGQVEREFAVQMHNLPEEPVGDRWDVRDSGYGGLSQKNGQVIPNIRSLAVSLPGDERKITLRFGVAAGPWKTEMETDGLLQYPSSGVATFSGAKEQENGVVVTVSHQITLPETRVIAIDREEKEHKSEIVESSGGYSGIQQVTVKFPGLTLKDISKFVLQSRPYEWVEFRNVAIEPKSSEKAPSSDKATFEPSSKDAAAFGPEIDRLLTDPSYLDADTDLAISGLDVKPAELEAQKEAVKKGEIVPPWMRERGIDFFAGSSLAGVDVDMIELTGDDWKNISPDGLKEKIASLRRTEPPKFSYPISESGRAFGFRTREGGIGMMQITGKNKSQQGESIMIRYKMISGTTKSPPLPQKSEPSGEIPADKPAEPVETEAK